MSVFRGLSPFDQIPKGVKRLLIANGILYLLKIGFYGTFMRYFALTPIKVLTKLFVWQLVTYSFLHGHIWHLIINMFGLWMFGSAIENYWGTKTFLKYYFLCVVGAALTQMVVAPRATVVGASGGIYGLLLAFGFLFPDAIMYLFFVFPLRAIHAVFVIALITLVSSLGSGGTEIAHFAHLGGMLTGFLYFKFPAWKEKIKGTRAEKIFGAVAEPVSRIFKKKEIPLSQEVDRILEKVSAKGLGSLNSREHDIMRRYGEGER